MTSSIIEGSTEKSSGGNGVLTGSTTVIVISVSVVAGAASFLAIFYRFSIKRKFQGPRTKAIPAVHAQEGPEPISGFVCIQRPPLPHQLPQPTAATTTTVPTRFEKK